MPGRMRPLSRLTPRRGDLDNRDAYFSELLTIDHFVKMRLSGARSFTYRVNLSLWVRLFFKIPESDMIPRRAFMKTGLGTLAAALSVFRHERAEAAEDNWLNGKPILDPHVHVVDGRHPSVPKMLSTDGDFLNDDLQAVARSIGQNMVKSGTTALGMPG